MKDADRSAEQARHLRARHLLGIGILSLLWFVSLAWSSSSDAGVIVSASVFGVAVAVLSVALLPRARAAGAGPARRWAVALLLWALALAAALAVGLLSNRGAPAYWLFVSPLVAGPAWIGARAEVEG
jgi:hypothetical protein